MSQLLNFMKQLGRDAELAAEYEKDRGAVIDRAGLSEEERRALLESDYKTIKRLSGLEDGQFATNHVIRAYVLDDVA